MFSMHYVYVGVSILCTSAYTITFFIFRRYNRASHSIPDYRGRTSECGGKRRGTEPRRMYERSTEIHVTYMRVPVFYKNCTLTAVYTTDSLCWPNSLMDPSMSRLLNIS